MDEGALVDKIVADIIDPFFFPSVIPDRISVDGGKDSVRCAVVSRLATLYEDSEVSENLSGGYRISLGEFIEKYSVSSN